MVGVPPPISQAAAAKRNPNFPTDIGKSDQRLVAKGEPKPKAEAAELFSAEIFAGAPNLLAAEPAVEFDGALVVAERPDQHGVQAIVGEIAASGAEQPRAEPHALIFGREIKFEDFAVEIHRRGAVAAIGDIAADRRRAAKDTSRRLPCSDGGAPPVRTSPGDQPFELPAGNDAAIGFAPSRVMDGGDLLRVARQSRVVW